VGEVGPGVDARDRHVQQAGHAVLRLGSRHMRSSRVPGIRRP
jgi:hypothetical protein